MEAQSEPPPLQRINVASLFTLLSFPSPPILPGARLAARLLFNDFSTAGVGIISISLNIIFQMKDVTQ